MYGGDVAYTEALVARPPDGVVYTTYVDAFAEGSLVERGRRPKHGSVGATDALLIGARAIELGLRRTGRLYREPYRYLTVDPAAFDLVHAHVFSVRLVGTEVPLVTSSGFPLSVLYRDRHRWPEPRVRTASRAESLLARATGVELSWAPPRRAARMMVQSEHYRDQLVGQGADLNRLAVRTLGIEGDGSRPRDGRPRTIGYVSTHFEAKGGHVVLEAFAKLLTDYPDARLVIVGSDPVAHAVELPPGAVTWTGKVGRRRLLDELWPTIDVLALPTCCDSGPPYVVLEALQRGIPVVTSDIPWLDEGLTGAGVRRVSVDAPQVRDALVELLDRDTYAEASRAAVDLWRTRYSMDVLAGLVGKTYREALAAGPARPGARHHLR